MVVACTRDCYDTCVFDENYKPLKLFPVNGFACSRGNDDLRRNSVNRVREAYVDGKEVSLEEAMRVIVSKVKDVKKRDSTRILQISYDGSQGLLTWYYPSRLWNVLGASSTDYSLCSAEGHASIAARYGTSFGATPEEFVKYDSVIFWGIEAAVSFVHGWTLFKDKYKVTIDVRKGITASRSDEFFLVRPGSDLLVALWIARKLLSKGYGGEVEGVDELKRTAFGLDPSYVSGATGLSLESLDRLASIYEERRPLTVIGFAMGRTFNGGDAVGMISLLPALLGMKRGFFYANSQGLGIDFAYLRGTKIAPPRKVIGMADIGERVDEVDFAFVWNNNPVHSLPNSNRIVEAVEEGKLFLVVHDPFWSETAKVANVVLPAPTFLEKWDVIYSYWHTYLVYNTPVATQKGITEWDLMYKLADQLGVTHPLLEESLEDAINGALRATGVTLEKLRKEGMVKLNPTHVYRPRVGPLPELVDPPKGRVLVFSSHPLYTNSQFKEVHGVPEPVALTNDLEGEGYIQSRYGRVKVKFRKDPAIPSNVVYMHKSCLIDLDGTPINALFGSYKGKYGGTPTFNGLEVSVYVLTSS
ncbi:dehydrogenase [Sulfodiicoccus acidiphilus]|uniref:Dehydrogenase n=1 Tax=Sulfodiicoccus acidiphilus TaxID=1670455 RepID=A0A348B2C4_9CREN|nr:molybdopterin-dependent oxidoreductase [Sulfodiicoccus acidiphilus]BBD72326.1 dehydrogenase [Sulfodiicoccus acidiphilus]GGT90256.1 dehydrogenase [Sulfodiicoccus acidiphilus]